MAQNSAIEWTDHTFNLVIGCHKVSPACTHCYAEAFAKRTGMARWGPPATTPRKTLSTAYWQQPVKWHARAAASGIPAKVFCSSLADVFEEHPTVRQEQTKLWPLIEATPALQWLLLTKRPEHMHRHLPVAWQSAPPANVWL